jgi:hypothetical protein
MSQASDLLSYIAWLTVLGVAAMVVALLIARAVKRRLSSEPHVEAFTIQDLRRMRDTGSITSQEYEAMRATLVAQMGADSSAPGAQDSAAGDADNEHEANGSPPERGSGN